LRPLGGSKFLPHQCSFSLTMRPITELHINHDLKSWDMC
jgi:hypothetical protein